VIASPRQRLATFDFAIRPCVIVAGNVLSRRGNESPCGRAICRQRPLRQPHFQTVLDLRICHFALTNQEWKRWRETNVTVDRRAEGSCPKVGS
jgi:hypothetical protein